MEKESGARYLAFSIFAHHACFVEDVHYRRDGVSLAQEVATPGVSLDRQISKFSTNNLIRSQPNTALVTNNEILRARENIASAIITDDSDRD